MMSWKGFEVKILIRFVGIFPCPGATTIPLLGSDSVMISQSKFSGTKHVFASVNILALIPNPDFG